MLAPACRAGYGDTLIVVVGLPDAALKESKDRARVVAARQRQLERFRGRKNVTCNARMGAKELKQCCAIDETTKKLP